MDVISFILGYANGKVPTQEKEITVRGSGKTEVTPDDGKLLSKVTVNAKFEGIEPNIAYGDEPSEDSAKVWVKCPRPNKVTLNQSPNFVKDITVTSVHSGSASSGLSNLAYKLYQFGSAIFGKTIYLFGGIRYNEETSATENSLKILAYDTEDNTCRELTEEMPGNFNKMEAAVTVGDYIYIVYNSTSMLRFNPATETFDATIDLGAILGSWWNADNIGNKIYISSSDGLGVYDLETGLYTSIGKPTIGSTVVAVGDKLFVFGDMGISCYDTVLKTMTTPYTGDNNTGGDKIRGTECHVTFGGREIFYGGYSRNSTLYRYDVYDNKITIWNVNNQLSSYPYDYAMRTVGDDLYMLGGIGGGDSGANKYRGRVQRVTVPMGEVEAEPGELVLWVDSTYGVPGEIITGDSFFANIGFGRFFYGDENGVGKAVDAYVYRNGNWEYAFRRY